MTTMKFSSNDLYAVLEVSPYARKEVIDGAYRALMKIYHTDHNPNTQAKAQDIIDAHEILSDASKRAIYDNHRKDIDGLVIGNYRVLERIAEGSFATTYKGEHILVKQPVCIKHCHRKADVDRDIIISEAQAVWDLRHYSIAVMRELTQLDDGSFVLIMSYIPGLTLEQIIQKTGRLDAEHVCWFAERLINALKYMHLSGVVHGDIKPQNIIIQPEDHMAVLVDYGFSAMRPTRDSDNRGYTEFFAPPEQLDKNSPLIPECDFYSLGMTMIYALSGGMDNVKRLRVPEDVPEPVCDFIRKLIVRDVLARPNWSKEDLFQTIQDVRTRAFGRARSQMRPIKGL